MSLHRRLTLHLLVLAGVAHAWSLATPWVRAWTPRFELHTHHGWAVLGQAATGHGLPWSSLALAHVLSLLTVLAAWLVPRTSWARALVLAAVISQTVLVALPLMGAGLWNTADAWPQGLAMHWIQALSPGQWWVLPGLLTWGLAQMLYTVVLVMRGRERAQAELQATWAHRPGAGTLTSPPRDEHLGVVPASLRPLVIDAHRLRVDLDTPVRPLDDDCRTQLLELTASLDRLVPEHGEALRRAGLHPAGLRAVVTEAKGRGPGWLAELRAIDHGLHRLINAALTPVVTTYR